MRTQFNYFLKIFSEGHNHESSGNNIEHRYTHDTTTQAECIPPYYLQKYIPPCLNMDCYPAYQLTIYSCTPPPPR